MTLKNLYMVEKNILVILEKSNISIIQTLFTEIL
jgi:hypothetical protein